MKDSKWFIMALPLRTSSKFKWGTVKIGTVQCFGEYFHIRESPKIQIFFVICQAKMLIEKKNSKL
jgi:hypothetical protein